MRRRTLSVSNYVACILLAIFCVMIFFTFREGPYIIYGNLHDLFIPLNSAYAVSNGADLHNEFHSPFGLLYHLLNYLGYQTTLSLPDVLNPMDTILLTSVFCSVVFILLFLIIRRTQPKGHKLTLWAFLLLFTLIFQLRNPNDFVWVLPLWYAIYNYQNWAFLLLQITHSIVFLQEGQKTPRATMIFAAIQATLFLIALHYKISFLAASGLVVLAAMIRLPIGLVLRTYLPTGLAIVGAVMALVALAGYDYAGYLSDNMMAVQARSTGLADSRSMASAYFTAIIFVILMQLIRFHDRAEIPPGPNLLQVAFAYWRNGILPHVTARIVLFDSVLALAILAAAAGDFQRPWAYFLVVLWLIPTGKSTPNLKRGLIFVFLGVMAFTFTLRNFQSSFLVLGGKYWSEEVFEEGAIPIQNKTIKAHDVSYLFSLPNSATMTQITEEGLFEFSNQMNETLLKLSYTLIPESRRSVYFPNHNSQYADDINKVSAVLAEFGVEPNSSVLVGAIAFINPYPYLLGTPQLPKAFNWVHIGTTIAPDDVDVVLGSAAAADFLAVPVRDQLHTDDRVYLTCRFYEWNFRQNAPFVGVAIAGSNLIFASQSAADKFGLDIVFKLDPNDVQKECMRNPLYEDHRPQSVTR